MNVRETEALTRLPELLEKAAAGGETIVISRGRKRDIALVDAQEFELLQLRQQIQDLRSGHGIVLTDERLEALSAATKHRSPAARLAALRDVLAGARRSGTATRRGTTAARERPVAPAR